MNPRLEALRRFKKHNLRGEAMRRSGLSDTQKQQFLDMSNNIFKVLLWNQPLQEAAAIFTGNGLLNENASQVALFNAAAQIYESVQLAFQMVPVWSATSRSGIVDRTRGESRIALPFLYWQEDDYSPEASPYEKISIYVDLRDQDGITTVSNLKFTLTKETAVGRYQHLIIRFDATREFKVTLQDDDSCIHAEVKMDMQVKTWYYLGKLEVPFQADPQPWMKPAYFAMDRFVAWFIEDMDNLTKVKEQTLQADASTALRAVLRIEEDLSKDLGFCASVLKIIKAARSMLPAGVVESTESVEGRQYLVQSNLGDLYSYDGLNFDHKEEPSEKVKPFSYFNVHWWIFEKQGSPYSNSTPRVTMKMKFGHWEAGLDFYAGAFDDCRFTVTRLTEEGHTYKSSMYMIENGEVVKYVSPKDRTAVAA